jgi:tetratricopeptide (TPR) repeat protein
MSRESLAPSLSAALDAPGSLILIEAESGGVHDAWLDDLVAAAPGAAVHRLDARLRVGGPWAGISDFLDALVPGIDAKAPELLQRHRYELAMALPKLRKRFPMTEASLTDASPVKERVRSYPVDRAYRLLHGLVDLLDAWLPQLPQRQVLVVEHIEETSALMRRFFQFLARRRLSRLPLDVVLVAKQGCGDEVAAWLAPSAPNRLQLAPSAIGGAEDAAVDIDALEARVDAAMGQADNLLPRLIAACDAAGQRSRAARWRAAALVLYNHYGLYEDALYFGEPLLADFDLIEDSERAFGRWNVVSGLFNAYAALGRPEDGLRVVRDDALAKVDAPNDLVSIYYTLAMLHCRFLPQRDFALAEDYLQRAMDMLDRVTMSEAEKHYLAVFILNGVAFIRFQQGRLEDAVRLCQEGFERLDLHLQDSEYRLHRSVLLYNIGQVYAATRAYDEAIRYYSLAMELDPRYSEYYNDRGSIYLKIGRLQEAVRDFEQAIALSAPYFEVWTNLGQTHRRLGDHAAAVRAYTQALDIEPDAVLARVGRAQSHEALGDSAAALADYDLALGRDQSDARLFSNRAVLRFEVGRVEESLADLDAALQLAPDLPELYENRAVALAALGRHEEAERDREAAERLIAKAA